MLNQVEGLQRQAMLLMTASLALRLEQLDQQMKANPAFTIDQLRDAITNPAAPMPAQQATTKTAA